ncbi:MAG: hypothetical protein GC193_14150 [Cryomorphaceae bacterium]|nr:hypothetical protein [Cryomorphaceae bacterium]
MILKPAELEKVNTYMNNHPDAQDPMAYLRALGLARILELIDKSEGRKIKFSTVQNAEDGVEVSYV